MLFNVIMLCFAVSLLYPEAIWEASVCLMRRLSWPVGLAWEDGSRGGGEPHVAFPYCLCVFIWETLRLSYLKIASALRLGLSPPPIFIFLFSVFVPLIPGLLLCLSLRPSSSSRDTRNLIPGSPRLASPVQQGQRFS